MSPGRGLSADLRPRLRAGQQQSGGDNGTHAGRGEAGVWQRGRQAECTGGRLELGEVLLDNRGGRPGQRDDGRICALLLLNLRCLRRGAVAGDLTGDPGCNERSALLRAYTGSG
jgi:hypothetical protein